MAGIRPLNKALLDTDILSEIGKARDATVAANAKTYRRSFGHFTFSTVSVMEVISGFQKTRATARLNAFLSTLPHMEILTFDETAAELAGRIAGDLERMGQPIGVPDTMIAAIAIDNGLELVTGNTSDYRRIQQLGYPLTLANWRV
jgi:predicted nucleic acid-binding protein